MINSKRSLAFACLSLFVVGCDGGDQNSKSEFAHAKDSHSVCRIDLQDYTEPKTKVLDRYEIDKIMRGDLIDAPITILKKESGKSVFILPTALQQAGGIYLAHTFVEGDLAELDASHVYEVNESKLFKNSPHQTDALNGRHWITNLLETDEGVLAFLHTEYSRDSDFFGMSCVEQGSRNACAPGLARISLAWMPRERMNDPQASFTVLGPIAGTPYPVTHFNVHGTPVYLTESGGETMINTLFVDLFGNKENGEWEEPDLLVVARAQAPLDEVIFAAQEGRLTTWLKRKGNDWVDAQSDTATSALPQVPSMAEIAPRVAIGRVAIHSDATYHPPSSSYILSAYTLNRDTPSSLIFYSSCDGENWRFSGRHFPRDDVKNGWSYLSLVGRDNTDGQVIDGPLDLIAGWEYGGEERAVYRLEITVPDSCSCP